MPHSLNTRFLQLFHEDKKFLPDPSRDLVGVGCIDLRVSIAAFYIRGVTSDFRPFAMNLWSFFIYLWFVYFRELLPLRIFLRLEYNPFVIAVGSHNLLYLFCGSQVEGSFVILIPNVQRSALLQEDRNASGLAHFCRVMQRSPPHDVFIIWFCPVLKQNPNDINLLLSRIVYCIK